MIRIKHFSSQENDLSQAEIKVSMVIVCKLCYYVQYIQFHSII